MVVGRDYMLKQPKGPSAPKLFLDTKLVPAGVNLLGSAEVALNRASARTGVRSGILLGGTAGLSLLGLCWLMVGWNARTARDARLPADGL